MYYIHIYIVCYPLLPPGSLVEDVLFRQALVAMQVFVGGKQVFKTEVVEVVARRCPHEKTTSSETDRLESKH